MKRLNGDLIMKKFFSAALLASALAIAPASAAVTFTGNFIGVSINNQGTLSSLKHDPAGNGVYGVNDYITPGSPHEGFSTVSTQGGFAGNTNAGGAAYTGPASAVLTGAAALGYTFAAGWTGGNSLLSVNHRYFYNNGDERIRIITTITALSDLTSLAFARSVDPDPDVNTSGSFSTNNQRGNSLFGTDDFIGAAGPVTGLTLALVNNNGATYTSNTLIGSGCCSNINPTTVLLGGPNSVVGDRSLNMAWNIGDLRAGSTATIEYFYAVGAKIDTTGGGGAVPESSTWMMMIAGFGIAGMSLRSRRRNAVASLA
jgi:hypothetical protein